MEVDLPLSSQCSASLAEAASPSSATAASTSSRELRGVTSTSPERDTTAAVMIVLWELVTADLFICLINFSSLIKLLLISHLIHVSEWEE